MNKNLIMILYLSSPLCAFIGMVFSIYIFNSMGADFVTNYFYYCLIASGLIMVSFYLLPFALAKDIEKRMGDRKKPVNIV